MNAASPQPLAPEPPTWLVDEVRVLELPRQDELRSLVRDEAAAIVDRFLVRVARGRGAIDLAMGECLAAFQVGGRVFRLGYVSIGDLAREKLGLAPRTAQLLAQRARVLRTRPLLRAAVVAGEVSPRKADAILHVAVGDAEAEWVARARAETVRALEVEAGASSEEEPWERIDASIPPEHREVVDVAFELAGALLGVTSPRWRRLEAMCQEFLAGHPMEPRPDEEVRPPPVGDLLEPTMAAKMAGAEHDMQEWRWLDELHASDPFGHGPIVPVAAPVPGSVEGDFVDPIQLDEDLRRLARMRARWDTLFGHLALLVQYCRLWRDMGFASFGHYCTERLGMSHGAVTQRTALERRLHVLPALREALESGRLSYEKARAVAFIADETSLEGWIAQAERLTCIQLQRAVAAAEDAQMCARREAMVRVPAPVAGVVQTAFRAAREAAGRWLSPGECLAWIAASFIATWSATLERSRPTRSRKVIERDQGFCQVPGCSRAADHAHHVEFRSAGGSDDGWNKLGGCACHHLNCIHTGFVRVTGRAPDGLRWELGLGWDGAPLEVFEPAAAQ